MAFRPPSLTSIAAFEAAARHRSFTAAAREFGERLPDARVVWLSPARHAGVLEQPEQFREALVGFLGEARTEAAR